jgi:tRNA G18 (ribose-2'-O)-methylase SpoU
VIQRIADASDPAIAPYRDVGDHAALARRGLFVAEGRLVVERLLADARFPVHSILLTHTAARAMASILESADDARVYVCEPSVLHTITGFDFHRGCLALAHREPPFLISVFSSVPRLLALEGVSNPDNVGGLFRVALALDAGGLLLDPTSGDPLYRKAIRTSMGAALRLPFARVEPWPAGLAEVRANADVIALTPDPAAVSLDDYTPQPGRRLILLLGAEGPGLTDAAMRYADVRLRIPVRPEADSLNVVVAAGIALHALARGPWRADASRRGPDVEGRSR